MRADYPQQGVKIACRFTAKEDLNSEVHMRNASLDVTRDIEMLSTLLSQIDAGASSLLKVRPQLHSSCEIYFAEDETG